MPFETFSVNQQLRYLLDLEEIRQLKHRYLNLCDAQFQAVALAALFVEDGIWTGPEGYGHHQGRPQLIAFFRRLGEGSAFVVHLAGNDEIAVDGDTARGRWTVIAPGTSLHGGGNDFWSFLRYEDEFQRVDGRWMFRQMRALQLAGGTHEAGWAASLGR